jgi:hypothetical protein
MELLGLPDSFVIGLDVRRAVTNARTFRRNATKPSLEPYVTVLVEGCKMPRMPDKMTE